MITIKQLGGFGIETIHEAFRNAFSDYVEPFDLTIQQLQHMIERRGCNLDLSFGAFDDNELVGFTLNGIGDWEGKLTAYDTGTGVIKKYRKKGIATKMFTESLPILREHHISNYLLEVICSNKGAFDLYKKAGFEVVREFDYYMSPKDDLLLRDYANADEFTIEKIVNLDWDLLKTFWDFEPSWQNSIESINRKKEYFTILGIYKDETLSGYGIIEKPTGDIPQIGIAPKFRRSGAATVLLKNLIPFSDGNKIKIINSDASNKSFKKFAASINLHPGIGQYEMVLKI